MHYKFGESDTRAHLAIFNPPSKSEYQNVEGSLLIVSAPVRPNPHKPRIITFILKVSREYLNLEKITGFVQLCRAFE